MSFYASLTTIAILPIFIGFEILGRDKKIKLSDEQYITVYQVYACCLILKSFKSFYLDRGLRKRFKEDFDAEL